TDTSKCLHYYFYFIDPDFGLCYLRVPTWCPFRLQFYMNGHNWLASRLTKQGIEYRMRDNAFLHIGD
ncbi:MarR family transcriptional regulator, partial [Paenibacillus alkaliterrae]|nr:MarR family transcriptional regulator [Paenibacillus alkaliterrae]